MRAAPLIVALYPRSWYTWARPCCARDAAHRFEPTPSIWGPDSGGGRGRLRPRRNQSAGSHLRKQVQNLAAHGTVGRHDAGGESSPPFLYFWPARPPSGPIACGLPPLRLDCWYLSSSPSRSMSEERSQALQAAVNRIKKQFGEGAVMRLGEATHLAVACLPTGALSLDLALGVGGIPRGRVTEIYGPEASGKTTVCQHLVAEAQRLGGVAAYIDMEHALDPSYAARCGVDIENLYISQPDTGEQALEIAETLGRRGAGDLVGGDSGGGMALKFYASVRIDIRRIESIKLGQEVVGSRVRARVVKNKVAPPFKVAEFDIMYNEGISKAGGSLDLGVEAGLVEKRGSFYTYGEGRIGQGRENAKQYLRENPQMALQLEEGIRAAFAAAAVAESTTASRQCAG